jgi:hypothetical protein
MIVRVVGAGYLFFREADSFNKAFERPLNEVFSRMRAT